MLSSSYFEMNMAAATSKLQYQNQKPSFYPSRPTPLPDLVEENETDLPDPQANEPILVNKQRHFINIQFAYKIYSG